MLEIIRKTYHDIIQRHLNGIQEIHQQICKADDDFSSTNATAEADYDAEILHIELLFKSFEQYCAYFENFLKSVSQPPTNLNYSEELAKIIQLRKRTQMYLGCAFPKLSVAEKAKIRQELDEVEKMLKEAGFEFD